METLKCISIEQQNMLKRLYSYHEKQVKIKMFDGTILEGKLTDLKPMVSIRQYENGEGDQDSDYNAIFYYLKAEHGT